MHMLEQAVEVEHLIGADRRRNDRTWLIEELRPICRDCVVRVVLILLKDDLQEVLVAAGDARDLDQGSIPLVSKHVNGAVGHVLPAGGAPIPASL